MISPQKIDRNLNAITRKRVPRGKGIPRLLHKANPYNFKPSLNMVTRLMKEIDRYIVPIDLYNFPTSVGKRKQRLGAIYGKRDGEEIARKQKIVVSAQRNRKDHTMIKLTGCHAESLVLHAALTKAGVPAKIFRYIVHENKKITRAHSVVVFRMNGKIFAADVTDMTLGSFDLAVLHSGKFIKAIPFSFEELKRQKETGEIAKELILDDQSAP